MSFCPACGEENPERARFCLACGTAFAAPAPLGEERKVVSVLFVDLVGFTDRSDRADPEDVRALLRPYHERVKADIERYGGTVEKFIGDAVMAVFGAPVAHEDDAERAVRAALRILLTIDELRAEGLEVAVRAAVTTGEAVVALGAQPERGEGMVAGDVVNTAARLQSAAPVGSVIVDSGTMRSAEGAIVFEELDPVAAKGKQEPIPVWRAVEARSRFGIEAEVRSTTTFVGRESELTLLTETFVRALREPSVQLVTVVGEPGVGKSRLVWEFRDEVDRRSELVRWRQGRCLPYGEGITFWALGEIVKAEAGVLETDSPTSALEKLGHAVGEAVDDEADRAWLTERLAPLVGAHDEAAGVSRDEAFLAWRRYLEALAAQRPTVIVLEDLHWADAALLEYVEHLLDWASGVPLVVVATARPELYDVRPGWGGGRRNSTTVGLAPLSDEETARLVAALLERSLLPAETQAALLEKAGGNPLYTEQFVRMHVEREGALDQALPETVQALIAARLDTLAPELKTLIQDAAVLGKVFWTGAIARMCDRSREDVLQGVRELVRREFVRPARVSSMRDQEEFSFWHVLVRDVAYHQIPRAARAEKHIRAAEWIEKESEGRLADQAEFLAHHYAHALELRRAAGEVSDANELRGRFVRFSALAGDRAMSIDIPAAEAAYRRALAVAEPGAERASLLVKLGDSLQARGRIAESEEAYEEAIPTLRESGEERAAGRALMALSRALWRRGQTARAYELGREGVALLEAERDEDLVFAYGRMTALEALGGRSQEALDWAEEGMRLASEVGEPNVVRLLQMRGIARTDLGDPSGYDDMRAALDLALELGLPVDETAVAYGNVGEVAGLIEGISTGRGLWEAGLELARSRGHRHHVLWTRAQLLWHLFHEGRWDELLRQAEELAEWDRAHGGTQIEMQALGLSAQVLAHRGHIPRASHLLGVALPRAREVGDPQTIQPFLILAAFIEYVRGVPEAAGALVDEYETRTRDARRGINYEFPVWLTLVALRTRSTDLAEELLSRSESWSTCGRLAHVHSQALLAEERGNAVEAARLYDEAATGWDAFGSVAMRAFALLGKGACSGDAAAWASGRALAAGFGAATELLFGAEAARQQQV